MRCLKCWSEIRAKTAIYTKSCNHVFCEECSSKAFKKELSCPLCDTVLPKGGLGTVTLVPDATDVTAASSKLFGFEPGQMCVVLQQGLEFWSKQRKNESLRHVQELRNATHRAEEAQLQALNLSKALDDERLKKKSLQDEKEALQRLVSELETRYAEKARSMRKLSDLYNELRQVHKRLEVDLRGFRDQREYEPTAIGGSELDVQTVGRSGNRHAVEHNRQELRDQGGRLEIRTLSERISHAAEGLDRESDGRHLRSRSEIPRSGSDGPPHSKNLFNLAPRSTSRSSFEGKPGKGRRRGETLRAAHDRRYRAENDVDDHGNDRRLTTRLSRQGRG